MFAAPPITGYHVATHRLAPLSLSLSLLLSVPLSLSLPPPPPPPLTQRRKGKAFNLNILIRFVINCEITIRPGRVCVCQASRRPDSHKLLEIGDIVPLAFQPNPQFPPARKRKKRFAFLCRHGR